MSMDYIRRHYGVPAKRGARVCYRDSDGVKWTGRITSANGAYIMVAVDDRVPGYRRRLKLHPTWHITYENDPSAAGVNPSDGGQQP